MVAPTSDTEGSGSVGGGDSVASSAAGGAVGSRLSIFSISLTVLRNGDRYGDLRIGATFRLAQGGAATPAKAIV